MSTTNCKICNDMARINWLFDHLNKEPLWAFDSETSGNNFQDDHIFCMSFSWKIGMGACIDFRDFNETEQIEIWERLKVIFKNKSRKITQNGVFDIKFLWARCISITNWYCDTILMAHLLDENKLVGLASLAHRFTDMGGYHDELDTYVADNSNCDPSKCRVDVENWKNKKKAKEDDDKILEYGTYENIPKDMLDIYACQDADVTLRIYFSMISLIKKEGLSYVLFNIQMPIQKILARVEYSGVTVDKEYLLKLDTDYQEKMAIAWKKILEIPEVQKMQSDKRGELYAKFDNSKPLKKKYTFEEYLARNRKYWEFKASTKQLGDLIITRLGQKPIKYGKTNKKTGKEVPSMDAEVLAIYAQNLPQVEIIQEYRTLQHLHGTFVVGMLKRLSKDGRIRSNYPLYRTVTGRVASNDPNLNNIPRKAVEIKHQFVADPGCYLVEADYSQAEFRHWAHYSQDVQMIWDINNGIDIHKLTAAMGKGLKIPDGNISYEDFKNWTDDVTKEERNNAKQVVFGMMYGRGAKSIAKQLKITTEEADNIIKVFFKRYPTARAWLRQTTNDAKIQKFVVNLYGRKRRLIYINEYGEENKMLQNKAERQAVNSPIQGGASDTTFLAAIRIHKEMIKYHLKSRMVLTVYDSLIYNVLPEELEQMLFIIHSEMMRDTGYVKVRLDCEVKIGKIWGKLEEIYFDDKHRPELKSFDIDRNFSYITIQHWYYHPESDCILRMTEDEMISSPDGLLCIQLGIATTDDIEEGNRLFESYKNQ